MNPENDVLLSPNIAFILANSADPDEILPYVSFHLGLHCLPKYLFTNIQNEKVKKKFFLRKFH